MKGYQTKSIRCLGIDPGIANTGLAIVGLNGNKYTLLQCECIETDKDQENGKRYAEIFHKLSGILLDNPVDTVVVEAVYHNKNVSSSKTTAGVIAVVELLCAQLTVPLMQLTPQTVKQAVGCPGAASKSDVMRNVKVLLKTSFENLKIHHASDAAAAAIAGILEKRSQPWRSDK